MGKHWLVSRIDTAMEPLLPPLSLLSKRPDLALLSLHSMPSYLSFPSLRPTFPNVDLHKKTSVCKPDRNSRRRVRHR